MQTAKALKTNIQHNAQYHKEISSHTDDNLEHIEGSRLRCLLVRRA